MSKHSGFDVRFSQVALCGATALAFLLPSIPAAHGDEVKFERIQLSDEFYSEGGTHGDFNGDGHGDVAVGPWIHLGPDFTEKSRYYEGDAIAPIGYSENFLMYSDDVDADGNLDILVIGFPGKESWWYRNPGNETFGELWAEHVMLASVDNESPLIADIDGDGIQDLICSSGGHYGFASHAGADPTLPWKFTQVSPNNGYQRFTHGIGIGDVDNDGDQDLLEKDGWWENPGKKLADGEFWSFHPFEFSSGGAQMYAVDLDGDGKNEVVTSLVAHGYGLSYYSAQDDEANQFERVDIMTDKADSSPIGVAVSQLHGVDIADINGDGTPDIVTGKRWWAHANKDAGNDEPATLLWIETVRAKGRLQFIPHIVDINSGVGCQIVAGDVNGDGLMDLVSGCKRGAYLFLQKPAGRSEPMVAKQIELDRYGQQPAESSMRVEVPDSEIRYAVACQGTRILNLGFETGDLTDWEVRGPIAGNLLAEVEKSGDDETSKRSSGKYHISTNIPGARMIGEAISRPFKITHPAAEFLFSGGGSPDARVEIVLELSGRTVASYSEATDGFQVARVDLSDSVGQLARIRIVDHSEKNYVGFDAFQFVVE